VRAAAAWCRRAGRVRVACPSSAGGPAGTRPCPLSAIGRRAPDNSAGSQPYRPYVAGSYRLSVRPRASAPPAYGGRLSVRPRTSAPPAYGGCFGRFCAGARRDHRRRPRRWALARAQAARRCEGAGSHLSFARCSRANGRSCRSACVDWVVSAARRPDDPRQARVRARTGARCAARSPSSTLTDPHGKGTASGRAVAGLRSALPAPLPKSASDWMHARGRFPQRSGTNAATPPMIVSPSCANRFAKSLLVGRSHRPC
jgi:hypothetical protein